MQISIYPSDNLFYNLQERAENEKRSLNNMILLILEKEVKNGRTTISDKRTKKNM